LQRFLVFAARPMVDRDSTVLRADVESATEAFADRVRELIAAIPLSGMSSTCRRKPASNSNPKKRGCAR